MEPIHYLRALRRRWWVIVAAVLVAGIAAWITTESVAPLAKTSSAPTYSATSVLWDPGIPSAGRGSPITSIDTLAQVVTLPDVATAAARLMHFKGDPLALRDEVQASADKVSGFLNITGFASDPKSAEQISTAFSHALITYLAELKIRQINEQQQLLRQQIQAVQTQGFGADVVASLRTAFSQLSLDRTTPISLTVIQQAKAEATAPHGFQPPKSKRSRVLLALLLGLLAGLALALILERFDTKIRTLGAAEEAFRLPVLAEVPAISRARRKGVVTATHPISRAAGAFRLLSLGIARSQSGNGRSEGNGKVQPSPPPKTILVTSAEPREGKTTVAANLAAAYAEIGNRVLVISCDLRRPEIHKAFDVAERPGLVELLSAMNGDFDRSARFDLSPYVGIPSVPRIAVLPSGTAPERPGELLGSLQMQRFVGKAKDAADVVILDCAPLLVASEVAPLTTQVDAVVLVARSGKTRAEFAGQTTDLLERLGAKVSGVVLNDARDVSIPFGQRRRYRPTKRMREASRMEPAPQLHVHPPQQDGGPNRSEEAGSADPGRDTWAGLD